MSKQINGVVAYVGQNKAGFYSVKMDDDSWYGFGKKKPPINKGSNVTFKATQNGNYWNADADSLEVIGDNPEQEEAAPVAKKSAFKPKPAGMSKDDYWNRKEDRDALTQNEIRLQASRNAAIAILDVALKNNVIVIPEGKKKGGQFDVLLTYVDKLTQKYFDATVAVNKPVAKAAPTPSDPTEANEPESYEELNDDLPF